MNPTPLQEDEELAKKIMMEGYYNYRSNETFDAVLKNCTELLKAHSEQKALEARADEIQRICDEVGIFTKKRNKFVYNVQLPIQYLIDRGRQLVDLAQLTNSQYKEKK